MPLGFVPEILPWDSKNIVSFKCNETFQQLSLRYVVEVFWVASSVIVSPMQVLTCHKGKDFQFQQFLPGMAGQKPTVSAVLNHYLIHLSQFSGNLGSFCGKGKLLKLNPPLPLNALKH